MPKYSGFDPIESHNVLTSSTTTGGSSHANTVLTTLYLPFNDDVNDDSPFSQTITNRGSMTIDSTYTKFGSNALKSQTNGSLKIDNSTSTDFDGNGHFTIEFFLYVVTPESTKSIYTHNEYNNSYQGLVFFTGGSGRIYGYASSNGSSWNIFSNKDFGIPSTGAWHHVAMTYDGTTYRGYLDGTRAWEQTSSDTTGTGGDHYIFSRNDGGQYQPSTGSYYMDDFRITKGKALYTDASITVPTSALGIEQEDPVSLYLPFDSDVNDDSSHSHTVTASGSATISSTQAKFGGNSLSLNGTSQYLTVPNDNVFDFGSEDFTIEMWIYMTSNAGSSAGDRHALVARRDSSSNRSFHVGIQLDGGQQKLQFSHSTSGSGGSQTNYNTDIQLNTWTHVAIVRSGPKVYAFVDGVKNGSEHSISTNTIYAGTSDLTIGYRAESSQYFPGYIDDLRISKGVSRYTKSFVPPSQAVGATLNGTNETNTTTDFTSLYLPFDSDVNDDSPNSHSVTVSGDAAISSTQAKFGSNSLALDGDGDSLSLSHTSTLQMAGQDFTIEAWVYISAHKNFNYIFSYSYPLQLVVDSNGNLELYVNDTDNSTSYLSIIGSTTLSTGTWHHIAVARNGSNLILFVDGSVDGSTTISFDLATPTAFTPRIGDWGNGGHSFNGYIDDLRVLKGYAKYTADFVPPSSAVGTSVSETVNDLTVLYMPFDGTETTSSVASSQTSLYLPFDSDTNDDSAQSHTVTNNGVTISSAQSKFGGYSALFDGTNDYLSIPSDSSLVFGDEDFTIEFFIYTNDDTQQTPFTHRDGSAGAGDWTMPINRTAAGQIEFYNGDYSISTAVVSTTISGGFSGAWHHIAVTRSGDIHRLFFDGELKASATNSTTYSSGPTELHIGRDNYVGGRDYLDGYLDDFRVIKGTALYTESFTVPTSAVGATGTAISVVGGFEDLARNNSVTKFGDVKLTTGVKKFGTSSAYFDGTTDRLVVDHGGELNLSDGDFTIEGWFYFTSNGTARIFHGEEGSVTYSPWLLYATSAGSLRFYASSNYSSWDVVSNALIGSVTLNTWTHLAVTREGNSFRCFQDGTLNSTTTSSSSLYYNTDRGIAIGGRDGTNYMTGYVDDLRIVKGKAIYTESFTPPASAHGTELSETSTTVTTDTKALSSTWTMTNDGSSPRSFIDMRSDNTWANNEHLQTQPSHRWNPANAGGTPGTTATGGSIATPGNGYRYHVFTSPGTFELSAIDGGSPSLAVEYLIVAGGGGGAANRAGGGGAGGLRTNEDGNPKAGSAMTIATGSFPVVVGTGGSGGDFVPGVITYGDNGTVSSFNSIESAGGGTSISPGGSGGGGHSHPPQIAAGSGNTPPVSPPQGNPGGNGHYPHGGGGGGGAGAAGSAGNPNAGAGGAGHAMPSFSGPILSPVIPGSMATAIGPTGLYAGGGGGGGSGAGPGVAGAGGPGGGGNGGNASVPPSSYNPNSGVYGPGGADAVDGTGGGGGGGGNAPGNNPWMQPAGDGGNGIVIIKYAY